MTNGIVGLFREYYGRGPTKAKSYLLDDTYVVCVLHHTMTTVEQTLVKTGQGRLVREVRLTFQEALADSFRGSSRRPPVAGWPPTTASSRSIPTSASSSSCWSRAPPSSSAAACQSRGST